MSFVDVSPSMEMLLKEVVVEAFRSERRATGSMAQSVAMRERRVAMFGWIMPAPFVMPAML